MRPGERGLICGAGRQVLAAAIAEKSSHTSSLLPVREKAGRRMRMRSEKILEHSSTGREVEAVGGHPIFTSRLREVVKGPSMSSGDNRFSAIRLMSSL